MTPETRQPTRRELVKSLQDTLRPYVNHHSDCTLGQSNPDGDFCTCGVRAAITKANEIAKELARDAADLLREEGERGIAGLRTEMRAYLDAQIVTSENIGDIRRSLFLPWDSLWNGWVRDETAARENRVSASRVDPVPPPPHQEDGRA